jgi:catechol 2,3-dioxygenase-like lactoylglutathione lyase family enzyme
MSLIKAVDVAFVHFAVPDVAKQRTFLEDFGMTLVDEIDGTLYFSGAGKTPFCYALSNGDSAFLGFGIWAKDRADLEAIALHDGAEVEAMTSPGGGFRVRLTDPDGIRVDVIAGQKMTEPDSSSAAMPWNETGNRHARVSTFRRTPVGQSAIF